MEYVILFGLLAILLAIGVPVAFSLLAATLATVLYLALPPIVVFQQMGSDITSVALLLMSFAVMFGAAVAVRRETHFAFQTLLHGLPGRPQWLLKSVSRLIAAASGAGLMLLGGTLMIDEWPVAMAGAPLPSGLKFAGLCIGGALILLFAVERLLTGDYRAPDAPAGAED